MTRSVTWLGLSLLIACDAAADGSPSSDTGEGDTAEDTHVSAETTVETTPDVSDPDVAPADATSPDELAPPTRGFQIRTPPITVASGGEETYCYYFSVPSDEEVGVKRWESLMTAGSHHLILYFTAEAVEPDGTVTRDCDGFGTGQGLSNVPVWTYSTQTRRGEMVMPEGVGMKVKARQHGFVQMHYLNPTLAPLDVVVAINGHTFAPGEPYQQAAAFVTYHTGIRIPAGVGQTASAQGTCRVRDGLTFFTLSTHAHKRAVMTTVLDGEATIFQSDDWEHPGAMRWDDGYTFTGDLTYRCDYVNDRDDVVSSGQSADANEMCMAVGYFYPAQRPTFCINSLVVSQ